MTTIWCVKCFRINIKKSFDEKIRRSPPPRFSLCGTPRDECFSLLSINPAESFSLFDFLCLAEPSFELPRVHDGGLY